MNGRDGADVAEKRAALPDYRATGQQFPSARRRETSKLVLRLPGVNLGPMFVVRKHGSDVKLPGSTQRE
jgi:hypothetical protein